MFLRSFYWTWSFCWSLATAVALEHAPSCDSLHSCKFNLPLRTSSNTSLTHIYWNRTQTQTSIGNYITRGHLNIIYKVSRKPAPLFLTLWTTDFDTDLTDNFMLTPGGDECVILTLCLHFPSPSHSFTRPSLLPLKLGGVLFRKHTMTEAGSFENVMPTKEEGSVDVIIELTRANW